MPSEDLISAARPISSSSARKHHEQRSDRGETPRHSVQNSPRRDANTTPPSPIDSTSRSPSRPSSSSASGSELSRDTLHPLEPHHHQHARGAVRPNRLGKLSEERASISHSRPDYSNSNHHGEPPHLNSNTAALSRSHQSPASPAFESDPEQRQVVPSRRLNAQVFFDTHRRQASMKTDSYASASMTAGRHADMVFAGRP